MKIKLFVKSVKLSVFAVILTAFLALALGAWPAFAAGVGVMKRGGERDSSSAKRAEKASSERGSSVERSQPSRSSGSTDARRRNTPDRQTSSGSAMRSERQDSPSSSSNRPNVFSQSRSSQPSRNDNRPQREDAARSIPSRPENRVDRTPNVSANRPENRADRTPNVSSNRPENRADRAPNDSSNRPENRPERSPAVVTNRPTVERRSDNRPQRQRNENVRDNQESRTTSRPSISNSRENRSTAPEVRRQERGSIGATMGAGRRESPGRTETSRPQISNPTRSPNTDSRRPGSSSPARVENRPQRVGGSTRDYRSDTTRVHRSPDRVITRVYEKRREWRDHYRDYDHKWRPSYRDGFYYYRSRFGVDPWYYGYYSFAYVPRYTYPSIYFHYGAFPYIYRDRVVILTRPHRHYIFVTLDLGRIFYDNDYYLDRDYIPYNGYVLSSSARRSLRSALDDIRYAWEDSDNDRLLRHVIRGRRIDVYDQKSYSYSIDFDDYRDMTRDAMATIDTVDFGFTNVRMRSPNEVVAYGRHNYYDSDDDYATVYVSYTLERVSGRWYITEVGSSRYRLDD